MLIGVIIALTHLEGLFCNVISLFPICVEGNSWNGSRPCRILLRLSTELWRTFCCHVTMSTMIAFLCTTWFQSSIELLPSWKRLFCDSFHFRFVFVAPVTIFFLRYPNNMSVLTSLFRLARTCLHCHFRNDFGPWNQNNTVSFLRKWNNTHWNTVK